MRRQKYVAKTWHNLSYVVVLIWTYTISERLFQVSTREGLDNQDSAVAMLLLFLCYRMNL